ncbi:MAG: hypothetical protein V1722_00665 [Candidatus Micrarchaeota archaeon]
MENLRRNLSTVEDVKKVEFRPLRLAFSTTGEQISPGSSGAQLLFEFKRLREATVRKTAASLGLKTESTGRQVLVFDRRRIFTLQVTPGLARPTRMIVVGGDKYGRLPGEAQETILSFLRGFK